MSRNYAKRDISPIPGNIAEYMRGVANSKSRGPVHPIYGNLWIKRDPQGYIINPEDMDLKCGSGPCEETAYMHFLERNGDASVV